MSKFREISIGIQRETMTRSNFRPLFMSIATDQKWIGALGLIEAAMMIGYKKSDPLFMHSNIFFWSHEYATSWSMEMHGYRSYLRSLPAET